MGPVQTACTPDSLTVYWEKDPCAAAERPALSLDGGPAVTPRSTHWTFDGLTPDTCHTLEISGENGKTVLSVRTPPSPVRLNVKDFGAVGDGSTLNTRALQAALDACGKGQEVFFPAGVYLTGALRMHSDMSLYLSEGAVLQGTDRPEDYLPKVKSRFEGIEQECFQSLLNLGTLDHSSGPNCRNVLLHGQGVISGGGQALALNVIASERERLKDTLAALGEKIREYENDNTIPGRARGRLVSLFNCENVRMTGLTLQNGASWNVHMVYSRHILTDHCVFRSRDVWNGDGWDPDSSEDCTLFASSFYTGDDSVAIKSGKNPEGNVIARPARRIRIFDCVSHEGLGIAIGSEMSGGVEDVRVWDCDLRHSLYGVQIKGTKKRGGYVRDVVVSDCVLPRFLVCAVLYNDDGEGAPLPPRFSGIRCQRVRFTCWAKNDWEKDLHEMPMIDLKGFDVPGYEASDLSFEDCTCERPGQVLLSHCKNVSLDLRQAE